MIVEKDSTFNRANSIFFFKKILIKIVVLFCFAVARGGTLGGTQGSQTSGGRAGQSTGTTG